jgi:hypothetical protein
MYLNEFTLLNKFGCLKYPDPLPFIHPADDL